MELSVNASLVRVVPRMSVVGRSDWYFNNLSENHHLSTPMIKTSVITSNDSPPQNCVYSYQDSLLHNLTTFTLLFVLNFCDTWLACSVKHKCSELFISIHLLLGMAWSASSDSLAMALKRSSKLTCSKISRQKR